MIAIASNKNLFASNEYALLAWLSVHQTETRYGPVVMFSQNDLVKEHQCSPATINKWMKALCKSGCLEPHKKRGNYRVTEAGNAVIDRMREIELIIGGNSNGK